jgi:hypothetical protein
MTLAAKCLLEIQTVFPKADARVDRDTAEIIVPVPNSPTAPLVLGSGRNFDTAAIRAVLFLGSNNPEFARRSAIYGDWAA